MKDPCDDSVVLRVIALFRADPAFAYKGPEAVASAVKDPDGQWRIALAFTRNGKRYFYALPVEPGAGPKQLSPNQISWGFVRIGATVWEVMPSVHVPTQLHAHVTVINVPVPAPWEGA